MTYNEFVAKHPILNLFICWLFFGGMLSLLYFVDSMSLTWCLILNIALALLIITAIVFMLDPKHKAKVDSYYKAMAEDEKKEKAQKRKEWNKKNTPEKIRAIWLKFLSWILGIAIAGCIFLWIDSMGTNFACDETTMSQAEELLNEAFPNFHGALKLSNPVAVKSTDTFIRCKTNANIGEVVYYNLEKQPDGGILITTNPIGDIIEEAAKEMEKEMKAIESEMDSYINDSYFW